MACRSKIRAEEAINEISNQTNKKNIEFMELDLSDLESVKKFVENFKKRYNKLDILINNAGLISDERKTTK